jgi:hypothetical protein
MCIRNALNALLFTPYYSTRPLPAGSPPLIPNFHDIHLNNVRIQGVSNVKFQGYQADSGGYPSPAYPLTMFMNNVVADDPTAINLISSDANLALTGVNLPLLPSSDTRVLINGAATRGVDPSMVVDCSRAYVDFPSDTSPMGTTWQTGAN